MKGLVYHSPAGLILLKSEGGALVGLDFTSEGSTSGACPILEKAALQLGEYFTGARKSFDLPLRLEGSAFQKKVWEALLSIPYGKTISYKELALRAGSPQACRAAGNANNKNPVSVIVPCHRVIGADGSLRGYGGGIDKKVFLLKLEGAEPLLPQP